MPIVVEILDNFIIIDLLELSILFFVLHFEIIIEIETPELEYFNQIILFDPKGVHYTERIQEDKIDTKGDNYCVD